LGDLAATTDTETVYNWASVVVGANGDNFITFQEDGFGDHWVQAEDCNDTS